MKIKRVECDQFAGIQGKEVEFEKGLNIIVGNNECGKSTMVDLIFYLLFKDVKLDGRSDTDFIDKYFPKKVSGPQGDVIDGVLVFETENGTYKIKKEWEKGEGTCRLTLPDGTSIKGISDIKKVLSKELGFREGVFNEIVFASQKRNHVAVESIMRALGKNATALSDTRADLTSTLNQAALETGGVSLDKLESNLKKKIDDLIGRWDEKADAPEGGPKRASYTNAWANGAGLIVKAYYEFDEIKHKQEDAENAEKAVEKESEIIQNLQTEKKNAEGKKTEFQKYSGLLGQLSLLSDAINNSETCISDYEQALEKWPEAVRNLDKAKVLQKKLGQAKTRNLFTKADAAFKALEIKENELKELKEVNPDDLGNLRKLLDKKQREENKLAGMNLVAKIKKLGSADISITSVSAGKKIPLENEKTRITEAVNINIPGVMEMQLMPEGVDVETVKGNISDLESGINKIYEKYGVQNLDDLQSLSESYANAKNQVEQCEYSFKIVLGDNEWDAVKKDNESIPENIESADEVNDQIVKLCGDKSVDAYIGGLENQISEYENRYTTESDLDKFLSSAKEELKKNQDKLAAMDEIPDEYKEIEDAQGYETELQSSIDDLEDKLDFHNQKLRDEERKLGDKSAEEYTEELREKEEMLASKKSEYLHWKNIYAAFCRLKDETKGNPVGDIEFRFNEYLNIITNGGLKLESMDENMSANLSSGIHALTYDILSDGTKDTISLAFRLAMLEHLYPDGNGLAVFDDPFTDMDPRRVQQACKLIQKFAENNQVIFVTCDDKYKDLLSGNVINV